MSRTLHRLRAAGLRLRHGLPLRGGISGLICNDHYVSHVSIHLTAAQWAEEADVLEVGARGGDGLDELRRHCAPSSLRGLEADPRLVRSARRRFGLDLGVTSLDALPGDEPPADLLLAVNILQQLADPDRTLDWMAAHGRPGARAVVSVPPVVDEMTMAAHRAIPECRSHRFIWEWELAVRRRFDRITIYRQVCVEHSTVHR